MPEQTETEAFYTSVSLSGHQSDFSDDLYQ